MGASDGCGGRRVDVEPKQAVAGRALASAVILQRRERARGTRGRERGGCRCLRAHGLNQEHELDRRSSMVTENTVSE
jgi:hypothetical protein